MGPAVPVDQGETSFPPTPPLRKPSGVDKGVKFPTYGNWGSPLIVEWDGEVREFVDGLGICSCNRWRPECRGVGLDDEAVELSSKLFDLVSAFVQEQLGDLRLAAFKLVLGKFEGSPFTQSSLDSIRREWSKLLTAPQAAMVRAEGQPFFLDLMAQTLRVLGDPDWEILTSVEDSFATGVPLCYKEPIPRAPDVFPERLKQSKLDESEYMEIARNYKSAEEHAEGLEQKFREDEALGMMYPSTLGALKSEFPGQNIMVAALGAIAKPDGSVRPLHDGTHYVQVNNGIVFTDQLQYPGPHDVTAVIREVENSKEAVFVVSADISAAHRRVKVRKADWHLLACKSSSDSPVIWVNKVGTFGISSAPYYWTRLFGLVGRLVARILLREWLYQVVYVDDLHLAAVGPRKFLSLWVCIALFEIVGTPFAYHKFAGGLETQFVGYFLDYRNVAIGVSSKRGKWLLDFLAEFRRNNFTIHMRRFSEFLGRLGFLCRVLLWVKPHLSPLCSWAAALDRSTVAKAPKLVILTCLFLEEQLTEKQFMLCCRWPVELKQEVFRTDAKCESGRIVFCGHHLGDGRWFSLEFGQLELPCLFKDGGDSQWASTPAELLAVMFALHCFGFLECTGERREVSLAIQGGTDNKANDALSKRASSTKWRLMLVNMQYSHLLKQADLRVNLQWRPRDENQLADDLTNLRFDSVDMSKRVQVRFGDLDLSLLKRLWDSRDDFLDKDSWSSGSLKFVGSFEKSQWA